MEGFWAGIWRSRTRSVVAGAILSVVIASVLYGFNWHTFYDTRRMYVGEEADRVAADIEQIVQATGAVAGRDERLRAALRGYLSRRTARIVVARKGRPEVAWSESNDGLLDPTKTEFRKTFELPDESGVPISITVDRGIRPSLLTALARAWTFSLGDYRRDPEAWRARHLYNRSLPLYGYLLTVIIVGFGTIRALHRDQLELMRLHDEAGSIAAELRDLSARHTRESESLRASVREREAQRDLAARERDRMSREIAAVEREYDEIVKGRPPEEVSDERLRGIKEKKSRIERQLAAHDKESARLAEELQGVRGELTAAEELLEEVESRHADLAAKLADRNRQIRNLQGLVQEARRDTAGMQLTSLRLESGGSDGGATALEDQLARWVESSGETSVGIAQHSRAHLVSALFEKIDRDFANRFFSHANNLEYERGARRLIRVHSDPGSGGRTDGQPDGEARHGELIIVLDDDAGRTLGLRFDLKPDAPDPGHVGFALALLLRAKVRELEHFSLRVR